MNQFQNFLNRFEKDFEHKETQNPESINPAITISYNVTSLIDQLYD
jgi:hypothetical protein